MPYFIEIMEGTTVKVQIDGGDNSNAAHVLATQLQQVLKVQYTIRVNEMHTATCDDCGTEFFVDNPTDTRCAACWCSNPSHADHLEQVECMRCNTPTDGQPLCPACDEENEDYYRRRDAAGYPVGAVGIS
jgi:hypothetical protein